METLAHPASEVTLDHDMLFVRIGEHKIGFWVRDRRLICPSCGTPSEAPFDTCYGCGCPLVDPLAEAIHKKPRHT